VHAEGEPDRAFPGENDQHVADRDDRVHKEYEADAARPAPYQERQDAQSRYDVAHPFEAEPPGDIRALFGKWQAKAARRDPGARHILGPDRNDRESYEYRQSERKPMHYTVLYDWGSYSICRVGS
jgi:hypothetical protein